MTVRRLQKWGARVGGFMFGRFSLAIIALAAPFSLTNHCPAQLCAQLNGFSFSQNFNTLATSGTNNTSLPSEFKFVEAGGSGNLTYSADNGASNSGETFSYGSPGSSDRALGEITSSSVQSTIGACFVNNTNHAFTTFFIGYTGEEWRLAATGTVDRLDFMYSVDPAANLTSGTYINVDELDFNTPNNTTPGSKDGNAASNRTVLAPFAITPAAPIQPEATFYIRWVPLLIAGADANDGLAIDDFSIGVSLGPNVATDYNNNSKVDTADYVVWRHHLNTATTIPNDMTPGTVVQQDFIEWRNRWGRTAGELGAGNTAPEPSALILIGAACSLALSGFRRR
jgi:hypothetical protein